MRPPEFAIHEVRFLYRKAGHNRALRWLLEHHYERTFARNGGNGLFRGVFQTFAEALGSAPPSLPSGYDHAAPAGMYRDRVGRVYSTDYPVLFWLERILPDLRRVFDFGGHVGVGYYSYLKYLRMPPQLQWTVCDVPAVVEAGRALAKQEGANNLAFTTQREEADGADLYFASGSLQYLEAPLAKMLGTLARKPPHVIINMVPLHSIRSFVTLQGIGTAYCPYLIQQRDAFIRSLEDLGYHLIDEWENPAKACVIPFYPDHSVRGYSGLYLTLRASETAH